MLKNIVKIILNRSQVKLIDIIIDILLTSLQEFRRAQQTGDYDINRHKSFDNSSNATNMGYKEYPKNPFENL